MKKTILPFALLIALAAAMTTGSLAIYTQTKALRGQLYTRVFLFRANEKSSSADISLGGLSLAPGGGEKELGRFELTNSDGSAAVSDYDMSVTVASRGFSAARAAMDGLVFRLYDLSSESGTPIATASGGELHASGIRFRAGQKQALLFRVTAEWVDTGAIESQTAVAASGNIFPVSLTVQAASGN